MPVKSPKTSRAAAGVCLVCTTLPPHLEALRSPSLDEPDSRPTQFELADHSRITPRRRGGFRVERLGARRAVLLSEPLYQAPLLHHLDGCLVVLRFVVHAELQQRSGLEPAG